MGHSVCCVVNCKNNGVRSKCKFYQFPRAKYKVEQRNKWIAAVRRKNQDGSPWCPKPWDVICSEHFIGNKKSEELSSPSYIPTIFPPMYKAKVLDITGATKRHERFMKRRMIKQEPITTKAPQQVIKELMEQSELDKDNNAGSNESNHGKKTCDQECQVDIFLPNFIQPEKTFICNRYINNTTSCSDAEIQTEIIISPSLITMTNKKQFKTEQCGMSQKVYINRSVGPDIENDELNTKRSFTGISSIKNNEQCLDLAGVTLENFQSLLRKVNDTAENCKISKENRLFICLVKMKTGLTFSAMSVLFSVHRTTISRIFSSTLQDLSSATANFQHSNLKIATSSRSNKKWLVEEKVIHK